MDGLRNQVQKILVFIEDAYTSNWNRKLSLSLLESLSKELTKFRSFLKEDIEQTFRHDPAAFDYQEILLSYPDIRALSKHRLAHHFLKLGPFYFASFDRIFVSSVDGHRHPSCRSNWTFVLYRSWNRSCHWWNCCDWRSLHLIPGSHSGC